MRISNLDMRQKRKKFKETVELEISEESKIQKLQSLITKSKHAVVQHILDARVAQNDLIQMAEVDVALKALLKSKLELSKVNCIGAKSFLFDKRVLMRVELFANIVGYGALLLKSFHEYYDDELSAMLQALPGQITFCMIACVYIAYLELLSACTK
jgi:hypothetical protein